MSTLLGDLTVKQALEQVPESSLGSVLLRLTGYKDATIWSKLNGAHGATKVRNVFFKKWPDDEVEEVGSYSVALARTLLITDRLATLCNRKTVDITARLESAAGKALVRNVLADWLLLEPGDEEDDSSVVADTDEGTVDTESVKVFISHSASNKKLAQNLVSLLEGSIQVPEGGIRCTSVPGYTLVVGDDSPATLRDEIRNCDVLVAIVTSEALMSGFVLMELGAAWAFGRPTCPICRTGVAVRQPACAAEAHPCLQSG